MGLSLEACKLQQQVMDMLTALPELAKNQALQLSKGLELPLDWTFVSFAACVVLGETILQY